MKGSPSGYLLGQSYFLATINATTMTRDSSETSFLRRALAYPNYLIYQTTMAKKIPFDTNKKSTGVLVNTEGREYILSATKEVILTTDVSSSPQLSLVSGVSPAATLQQYNVPVIADRARSASKYAGSLYISGSLTGVDAPTFFIPDPIPAFVV